MNGFVLLRFNVFYCSSANSSGCNLLLQDFIINLGIILQAIYDKI